MSLTPSSTKKTKVSDHKHKVLKDKENVVTKASFWGLKANDVSLKIGRHDKNRYGMQKKDFHVDNDGFKQGLTLDREELKSLIKFIEDEYQLLNLGLKNYIPIEGSLSQEKISALKNLFSSKRKDKLADLLLLNSIIPEDVINLVELKKRRLAVTQFESYLNTDPVENKWQQLFNQNKWILLTELIDILDDRRIDVENISDSLVKAPDGFVDVIELKRYKTSATFWYETKDHDNYIPHSNLIKAITQCQNYLFSIEEEMNSAKFQNRLKCQVVKPRITLIFGSSEDWDDEKWKAFRILNSSYHSISIITYDMLLERCKKIVYA